MGSPSNSAGVSLRGKIDSDHQGPRVSSSAGAVRSQKDRSSSRPPLVGIGSSTATLLVNPRSFHHLSVSKESIVADPEANSWFPSLGFSLSKDMEDLEI